MRKIDFFHTPTGACPIKKFLDSLNSKQAQKIIWVMALIEDLEKIPDIYFKKLTNTDDIWEIRVQQGSNIFRVLGFFKDTRHFLATNGFQKKTQKTPMNEIKLAQKRKLQYLTRKEDNK